MKITEARKLAKSKWGPLAFAVISRYGPRKYLVGKWVLIGNKAMKEYYGQGLSWEDAFERAARKNH